MPSIRDLIQNVKSSPAVQLGRGIIDSVKQTSTQPLFIAAKNVGQQVSQATQRFNQQPAFQKAQTLTSNLGVGSTKSLYNETDKLLPGIKSSVKKLYEMASKSAPQDAQEIMDLAQRLHAKKWSTRDVETAEELISRGSNNAIMDPLGNGFNIEQLPKVKDQTVQQLKKYYRDKVGRFSFKK